jgi:BASS family bile acid:Na+ symporter
MSFRSIIERYAGLVFCLALLLGILWPVPIDNAQAFLLKLLMGILLFISFLNIDFSIIKQRIVRPSQLIANIVFYFILLPALLYVVLHFLGLPEFAIGVLLLTAMPAGLGSAAFSSMANGRVETSVLLSVCTHLLVPVTVPLLFWLFAGISVEVNVLNMVTQLALLIFLPLFLALVCNRYAPESITNTKPYRKMISILALAGVAYFAIVPYASLIQSSVTSIFLPLLGMYAVYVALCLITFVCSMRRPPEERVALLVSRIYMNNALAIVLAQSFFGPTITLMMVLAEIPWFTTFGAYLWFQRRFLKHS